jgi:hypothetical protein
LTPSGRGTVPGSLAALDGGNRVVGEPPPDGYGEGWDAHEESSPNQHDGFEITAARVTVLPLVARRPTEIIGVAMRKYTENARRLVPVAAVFILPFVVIGALLILLTADSIVIEDGSAIAVYDDQATLDLVNSTELLLAVGLSLAGLVAAGALGWMMVHYYRGTAWGWQEGVRAGLDRVWPLLGVSFVWIVCVGIGFALFIAPGIWLAIAWWPFTVVMMVEQLGVVDTLRRSFRLTRGRWWATFGLALLGMGTVILIMLGLGLAIGLVGGVIRAAGNATLLFLFERTAVAAVQVFVPPFLASVTAALYLDLRVRHGEIGEPTPRID